MQGQGSWRPRVRRAGWRLPAAAEVVGWVVRRCSQESRDPDDHASRPAAHLCIAGCVGRGKRPGLQRMLGHTSAKVALDTYADLFDDDLDAVAVTLDSRYSRESVAKMWPRGPEGGH